jgi:hypothetical protein
MRFRTTRFLSVAVVMAGTSLVLTANANAVPDDAPVSGTAGTYAPAFLDTFVGAHYVVDTRSPSYGAALNAVGFDGTGPSALCHRDLASTLQKFGFKPLPVSGGVFCRRSDLKQPLYRTGVARRRKSPGYTPAQ